MSDKAKPYTPAEFDAAEEVGAAPFVFKALDTDRLRATVEALEKAEAEFVESQRNGALESITRKQAEAERDEARARRGADQEELGRQDAEIIILRAHNARLREALKKTRDALSASGYRAGAGTLWDEIDAALAGTSDEEGR